MKLSILKPMLALFLFCYSLQAEKICDVDIAPEVLNILRPRATELLSKSIAPQAAIDGIFSGITGTSWALVLETMRKADLYQNFDDHSLKIRFLQSVSNSANREEIKELPAERKSQTVAGERPDTSNVAVDPDLLKHLEAFAFLTLFF
jgi:hypothetical protein